MKDGTVRVAINKFVRLNPKKYSFLVDHSSKQKKANRVSRNVFTTISDNEFKDVHRMPQAFDE